MTHATQRRITVEELRQLLRYDSETGVLSWREKRPGPKTAAGKEAGNVKADGRYRSFVLFHRRHYTHRVAWEIVNGPIPEGMCIDHIDGNGLNNRLSNLRLTDRTGNQRNQRLHKKNRTGVPGVFARETGFEVSCASEYIGKFQRFEDAVSARKEAEIRHAYHPNNGRK